MNSLPFISQTKLDVLLERVCRPITHLTIQIDTATPLWDGPIEMCQQIEADVFAVDSVSLKAKKHNAFFQGANTTRLYHAILCRVYILLYYRHRDDTLYKEIVFPRLLENMGLYHTKHLNSINENIDKILAQEKLVEQVLTERKKEVKPVFAYVPHNRNEMDHLYIEYSEEQLFRNMSGVIKGLSHKYGTLQDEANVWYNAKQLVHTLRDVNRPELLIDRAATALVAGQIHNGYEGSQIILLCAYVMIRSSKDNAHFDLFIKKMESLSDADVDTDLKVIKNSINAIKKWMDENLPFDDYDYIDEQASNANTFTSADIERLRNQIVEQEKQQRDKLNEKVKELGAANTILEQQMSLLKTELEAEKAKKKAELNEDEQEVEMLTELESIPVLKLLWYLMQLDGANTEGHNKKKAAQNILSTLSKIPYNTTKHLWGNEDKPTVRQEDFLIKMNHWFEAIGMKFRF